MHNNAHRPSFRHRAKREAERHGFEGVLRGARMMAADTIDYQTDPSRYRHWKIERDGDIAYLIMDVDQAGGLGDYELKLNSYDLGVVIKSGKDNVFCAGANIRMLGKATHGAKVNFCKFTNETRLAIEDASENSK